MLRSGFVMVEIPMLPTGALSSVAILSFLKAITISCGIKSFEKVRGESVNYKIVGRGPGDVEKVWADTSFANQELGWKAQKSLDEMMGSAWKWEQALADKKSSNKH